MNKQEAIEKIKNIDTLNINDKIAGQQVDMVIKNQVLDIVSHIDEPKKVTIPKFVAEWYEKNRDDLNNAIYDAIIKSYRKVNGENDDFLDKFQSWLVYEDNSILILVQMQLFGYVVEKEKLYTVEIPSPNRTTEPIIYLSRDEEGKIFLNNWFLHVSQNWKKHPHAHLTESEIKEDFEWAWDAGFAKEVNNADD